MGHGGLPVFFVRAGLTHYTWADRAMRKSLRLMLRHAMYNLRGGFLIRPLTIALTLGCAGAFLSWIGRDVSSRQRLGAHRPIPFARRSASRPGHSGGDRPLHHDGGVGP